MDISLVMDDWSLILVIKYRRDEKYLNEMIDNFC